MSAAGKPQGCTNFMLRHLMRQVARRYDAELAACGLKTTQYTLLSQVLHLGPLRPGDLARELGLEPSTLTRNLRPMIEAGWIVQTAGEDARSRSVSITAEGRRKRAEAQHHWLRAQKQLNESLGAERVIALHALVDECSGLLQADVEEGAPL
jgi:DNA-binding MarR family transcriptional regulator